MHVYIIYYIYACIYYIYVGVNGYVQIGTFIQLDMHKCIHRGQPGMGSEENAADDIVRAIATLGVSL